MRTTIHQRITAKTFTDSAKPINAFRRYKWESKINPIIKSLGSSKEYYDFYTETVYIILR